MSENKIHVVCATDNKYLPYCGVMITSLFENGKDDNICVHVIGSKLDKLSISSLENLSNIYKQDILIYDFERYVSDEIKDVLLAAASLHPNHHVSLAGYNRFFISQILDYHIDRVIYFDCDVVICDSLKELWNVDVGNYAIGCVESHSVIVDQNKYNCEQAKLDFHKDWYFNSGVMLINLSYWRDHNLMECCIECIKLYPELSAKLCDQNILNYVMRNCKKRISPKFNVQNLYFSEACIARNLNWTSAAIKNRIVIHYLSNIKPWHKECDHPLKEVWLMYLEKSPWHSIKLLNKFNLKKLLLMRCKNRCKSLFYVAFPFFKMKNYNYSKQWY